MAEEIKTLTGEQKSFVVQALAKFDTPSQVADAVKEEFGIVVSRQSVQAYDPTKFSGRELSEEWRGLFAETRAKFLKSIDEIGIANKATRLQALNRMAVQAEKMKNFALAARLHEQAAKEVGGAFTNKVDLTSSDGTMTPKGLGDFYGAPAQGDSDADL